MNPNNPLKQYFRQPAIYLRLPSQGKFYPPGSLDMPPNNELPIYPMTAIDEITYRTPDALFNGSSVVNVVQSCVPGIHDAWAIPSLDVDSILIGIRIASFGHAMEFESTCPKCNQNNEHTIDLRAVLDSIKAPDYTKGVTHRDMEIYFRPMTYKNLNDNNQIQFEEQKTLQLLSESDAPESQKLTAMGEALKKITSITVDALAQSISAIKTPDAMVTEHEFIVDFLKNCDRELFNKIRDHIIETKAVGEMQPFELVCPEDECKHLYKQSITLDMTSFFAAAS